MITRETTTRLHEKQLHDYTRNEYTNLQALTTRSKTLKNFPISLFIDNVGPAAETSVDAGDGKD
jgi:hypothetical protein